MEHFFISRPIQGEVVCGDGVAVFGDNESRFFAVSDGLGHGPEAHHATSEAFEFLKDHWQQDLEQTILSCHESVRGTRGLALFLCRISMDQPIRLECGGIGNVECKTIDLGDFCPFSRDGIVGRNVRKVHVFSGYGKRNGMLAFYSDGISSRFNLEDFRGKPLDAACRSIIDSYGKDHDDATVLLIRL